MPHLLDVRLVGGAVGFWIKEKGACDTLDCVIFRFLTDSLAVGKVGSMVLRVLMQYRFLYKLVSLRISNDNIRFDEAKDVLGK